MPKVQGELFKGRPIIPVTVSDAAPIISDLSPQSTAPSFHVKEFRALLDTGADITCVMPHVVSASHLVSRGVVQMTTGGGTSNHMTYQISLGILCEQLMDVDGAMEPTRTSYQLPGTYRAAEIQANSWFDLIIGMDIIENHRLILDGRSFTFELN